MASRPGRSDPPGGAPSLRKRNAPSPQRHGATKLLKYTLAAGNSDIGTKSGLKPLKLVLAAEDGVSVLDTAIKRESPWNYFREHYKPNLGELVSVASKRVFPYDIFIVKRLKGPDGAREARLLRKVRHKNFHDMLECFSFEGSYYAVFEYVPISLAHVAKPPPFLSELELAAILRQVLEGLVHLASNGLEHGSLSCSNIPIGTGGDIKITGQESCQEMASLDHPRSRDLEALRIITMELM